MERTKPGHQGSDLAALVDDELKRCLDHAAEGLHWVGPDGTILWANQTELDMLGYSAEEYIGHNIREFHVDPPVIADILARLGRGETLLGYDARIRRRDGAIRHVQINSNVRWDGDRFLHTRCFTRDVTDRRTAHAQNAFLLDLDDTLRPLTSAADIAYTAAAALGRHLQVARCAYATVADDEDTCHVTGNYTDGVASIVGRSTLGEFGDECRRVLRQGEAYVVTDVGSDQRIEDGARGSYVASGIAAAIWVPILKQGRLVAAVTVHSVTVRTWDAGEVALVQRVASRCWESLERARVTADLRESEQQFRDLANSIANLAWMARPDGWIYWYNDQWYSYTGTTPEQMEGWGWQRVHDPACLPDVMAQWQRSIDTGQPFEMVFPLRSATGEFRRFLTRVNPVRDSEGRVVRWFGTNTDVEAERRATEASDRLREREEAARRDAEAASRAKDEFLAMLGHELRNPLAPILTALQLMKLRGGEAIDRERIVVERQVRHLARLVDDLLDVSRITRGKVELREEVIEIADVVAKAIETASPLLEERRHTLAVELPRQGVTVVGDATRLGQVFGNLLTNAAKYTPEAGASRSTAASKRSRSSCASATTGWGSPATCCRISSTCSCRNGRPWIGREAVSASA